MLMWYALSVAASLSDVSRLRQSRVVPAPAPSTASELCKLRGGGTKCDVVLVGCGVPKRGMGWYHGKQMLEGDVPSATMTAVVEPWFLGPGAESPPGQVFGEWAVEMEGKYGTKFVKDISELEIKVRSSRPSRVLRAAPTALSPLPRPSSRNPGGEPVLTRIPARDVWWVLWPMPHGRAC